jgi:hypothetical protein
MAPTNLNNSGFVQGLARYPDPSRVQAAVGDVEKNKTYFMNNLPGVGSTTFNFSFRDLVFPDLVTGYGIGSQTFFQVSGTPLVPTVLFNSTTGSFGSLQGLFSTGGNQYLLCDEGNNRITRVSLLPLATATFASGGRIRNPRHGARNVSGNIILLTGSAVLLIGSGGQPIQTLISSATFGAGQRFQKMILEPEF